MKLKSTFLEALHFGEEVRAFLRKEQIEEAEYAVWRSAFDEQEERFLQLLEEKADKEAFALELYLGLAQEMYPSLREALALRKEKGLQSAKHRHRRRILELFVPEEAAYDTLSDIRIWQEHYQRKSRKTGLIEYGWLLGSLKGRIYRLGRLQFEEDVQKRMLHIHIPEGERLNKEACEAAFALAGALFPEYAEADCLSWLLSPHILELLPEKSGIRDFQRLFTVREIRYDFAQASQRVLESGQRGDKESSLQKKLREYLRAHPDPGLGYGVIKL